MHAKGMAVVLAAIRSGCTRTRSLERSRRVTEATVNHGGTGARRTRRRHATPVSASREMVEPRRIHKPGAIWPGL